MPQEADNFEYICRLDEIEVGCKRCFYLPSSHRSVLLIHLRQGEVFCIDQTCYHHGGPLLEGDIEEIGGKTVITCPWHHYHIAIDTGEGLYMGIQPTTPSASHIAVVKSKGVKQRTHSVEIRNYNHIYVADTSINDTNPIESDLYAFQPIHTSPNHPNSSRIALHSHISII
uniref:Uncharacterized protein AlNc14C408G11433 n=1 Tax=Albugo laibachii Nc14 TaxID=890382 RepID=F0WZ24_9STRA|nr:conserved hypothetical protein [Albugo laibachii Nc14]|eukprot:CCA26739.1 conserved hypothetical protein [Albugo laibachii Nc14]